MSSAPAPTAAAPRPKPPRHYAERARDGDETWLEDCIEDVVGLTVTDAQREICRSVATNQKTLVQTANGLGKSYILAAIVNAWLYALYPATVLATSGTEKKMKRTFCKPVENIHDSALEGTGLPGDYKHRPERIDFPDDPEHWFEATSPQDAGELEGVHSRYHLSIIEEADKRDVDAEVVDAMDSLVTDERDRMIAIANPPEDETNVVADLLEKDTWETLQFSSFDSHNVQVALDEADGPMIDGLATLWKIKEDWREFNEEEWPGHERVREISDPDSPEYRDDLDARWYRRRAGVIPPDGAGAWRPLNVSTIRGAWARDLGRVRETPSAVGIDVARSGDRTVMIGLRDDRLDVYYSEPGANHEEQETSLSRHIADWPHPDVAVDAVGEGSGLADSLDTRFPNVVRFGAGTEARDSSTFRDCWAEGLFYLGQLLESGSIDDPRLREELLVAARAVEFEERHLASRGGTVIEATSKSAIKEELGRSPDHLDAALMAVWVARTDASDKKASPTFGW